VRFTQLAGKEIINLRDGQRLGRLGDCDLAIDEGGGIVSMLVPARQSVWRTGRDAEIPWAAIRRVGPEVLIVELELEELPRRSGRT
jgi:YlmC/YmxH family sporulation protein